MSQNISQETREQAQIIFQNGLSLLQQGKSEEADRLFSEAYLLNPQNADVLNLLGIRAYQKQEYRNAIDFLSQANLIAPHSAQTLSNLGLVHNALFEYAEALPYFILAIECDPSIPEVHNNHGNTLKGMDKIDEASRAYEKAITLRPNYAEALSNHGVLLLETGKPDKAIALLEQAIQANPNLAVGYNNLGNAFTQIQHYEDAFQCFERALQINPAYLDACLNFGNSLKKCKQIEAAIDCYQHALKINNHNAKTFYLLGEIYYDTGDIALAKTYLAKALEIDPSNIETNFALAISQIPKVYKNADELDDSRNAFTKQLEILESLKISQYSTEVMTSFLGKHPFYLAYQDENNRQLLSKYGDLSVKYAGVLQQKVRPPTKNRGSSEKIRIGIVGCHFSDHPVWHAITKGWVNHIDSELFDLLIFNTNGIEDEQTNIAKSKVLAYSNCGADLLAAAQKIAERNLDVILYPEIGMDAMCRTLACLRLAPVQVASWGHPETTGLPTIDFYLSAEQMEPIGSQNFYRESLITLPNLGTYFEDEFIKVINLDLDKLGINSQSPILLCAGSPSKYPPSYDQVLVQIAQKLGACQFVFFNFDENLTAILKERLYQSFGMANLNAAQFLRFIPFLNKAEFHGLMQKADLYLDTIGFSGFNTAIQALSSDLPVITIEGSKMRGRLASALLNKLNLQKLVCHSDLEYIELAVKLIENRNLLNAMKQKISKSKSTLFNDLEPIKALEKFLVEQVQKSNRQIIK